MTGCIRFSIFAFAVALCAVVSLSQGQDSGPVFLNIDHASVCGQNLDTMREGFASVGLTTDYGGPHSTGGTHMALVGFGDGSYLELIAPQGPAAAEGSGWSKLMAGNAGPCAWAVEPKDIDAEVARLKMTGVTVDGPKAGSRKKPDGLAIEWQVADVGSGSPGSTLPFLIQDRTPRSWRVEPSASISDSGLTGIEIVVIGVNDLNASIAKFRKAYGWAAPLTEDHGDFEAKLAYFPGQPVILAAPSGGRSWLAERIQKFGEIPAAYLLAAQDFNRVSKKFRPSGNKTWFGQRVAWFNAEKLGGARIGVLGQ
ncbi:MAG TPA: VOC family protein [Terriglobales bacterium]|nr:VOC family protein [Terriglobales bacterium]